MLLAFTIGVFANDSDMLQDVCVADRESGKLLYLLVKMPHFLLFWARVDALINLNIY